ncbi:zinc/cadmium/mercury/lead-transporting ATPase [Providencia sneebia]|uniref:P-type Zn(2+) transporter n=1 Tax=Providencia sneebia DSM 19967 TaxID=1141660 RepID=K8WR73_9GAMM|nr:zinc/cadmium/mercury/lead-transporting ATPase [Providencia sneebia]EKT59922.1 zinc/cadmium/mercury/lead-transporting ATPase [Providencia sneebia DSM 19967]
MHSHTHKETNKQTKPCCSGHDSSSKKIKINDIVSAHLHNDEHQKVGQHTERDNISHKENCCTSEPHGHDHSHTGHNHQHGDSCGASHNMENDVTPEQTAKQRFSWIIRGMDCPSCARKIENAIKQITEVKQVKVLFATEKLVVDSDTDISVIVRSTVEEAGYELQDVGHNNTSSSTTPPSLLNDAKPVIFLAILMVISWCIEAVNPKLGNIAFIATTLVGLYPIARKSLRLIRTGTPFAIETLMTVAAVGAIFIQATEEAAMVILLFMLGEMLESYSAGRARRGVSALMALVPEEAVLIRDGQKTTVSVSQLRPGDIIEIAPGGRLPTDAELVSGFASFDESSLTGESVPVERNIGEKVAAGCLSIDRTVQMKVVSEQGQSAIDRILQLIEEAEERRAPIERFIDSFSRIYTPLIMLFSALVVVVPPIFFDASWETWIYRGLTLLLIGCPCALVISTPAAITSALATATRRGALIKGGAALEQLGTITTIALDKTGTLTEGKPHVTNLVPVAGVTESELVQMTAAVEAGSHHPLAKAVVNHAESLSIAVIEAHSRRALAGKGVEGYLNDNHILVSSPSRLEVPLNTEWQNKVEQLEAEGKTVVVTLKDNQVIGLIALQDTLRPDAIEAISMLKKLHVNAVMLTGDNPRAASAIADQLGMEYRAGLLPEDKVTAVGELNRHHNTMMVGDGINDAPAMKASSIGVAMGSGTDVALETADAALTHNRLTGLPEIIVLSRATRKIIRENISIALGLKAVFLVTSLLGITGLWVAVLADSGATALVTANAVRLLAVKLPNAVKTK